MGLFVRKPTVAEAVQWTGDRRMFAGRSGCRVQNGSDGPVLQVETANGPVTANVGDWILLDSVGLPYPCRADVFAATYLPVTLEPVGESAPQGMCWIVLGGQRTEYFIWPGEDGGWKAPVVAKESGDFDPHQLHRTHPDQESAIRSLIEQLWG